MSFLVLHNGKQPEAKWTISLWAVTSAWKLTFSTKLRCTIGKHKHWTMLFGTHCFPVLYCKNERVTIEMSQRERWGRRRGGGAQYVCSSCFCAANAKLTRPDFSNLIKIQSEEMALTSNHEGTRCVVQHTLAGLGGTGNYPGLSHHKITTGEVEELPRRNLEDC